MKANSSVNFKKGKSYPGKGGLEMGVAFHVNIEGQCCDLVLASDS